MTGIAGVRRRRRDRPPKRSVRPSPGRPPGALVSSASASPTVLDLILYDQTMIEDRRLPKPSEIPGAPAGKLWLDTCGLSDTDAIAEIGARFGLHPLAVADIVHAHQRPKTEVYGDTVLVILRAPIGGPPFESEQVSFVIGRDFLLTFQERPEDCFEPVRERLREGGPRMRGSGPDYLAYALIDAVIDSYFPILEKYGEVTEALEERVIATPDPHLVADIHLLKRELLDLRRAIWPQREAINVLLREDMPGVTDDVRTHLRDCADHSFQLLDMVEIYREVAQGLVDLHLSSLSNRMNEIMKVLTIIATIFIPMTFIAGLYGMNFDRASPWNLPELGWRFGYLYALGLMAAAAGCILAAFWRKGWIALPILGKRTPPAPQNHARTGDTARSSDSQ